MQMYKIQCGRYLFRVETILLLHKDRKITQNMNLKSFVNISRYNYNYHRFTYTQQPTIQPQHVVKIFEKTFQQNIFERKCIHSPRTLIFRTHAKRPNCFENISRLTVNKTFVSPLSASENDRLDIKTKKYIYVKVYVCIY